MKEIDWPCLIRRLNEKADIEMVKIANAIDTSQGRLSMIKTESQPVPKQWHEAIILLDMYLKHCNDAVPRVGEYHEDML